MQSLTKQHSKTLLGRIPIWAVVSIFVISSALPLALLTTFSIVLAENGLRDEVRERLEGVAVASAQSLDKETSALGALVESYAQRSEISAPLNATQSPSPEAREALRTQLDQLRKSREGIVVTFITDARGRLVAGQPHNSANVGVDFSYRDWYRGVTDKETTYVSDAFESAASNKPAVVAIATPIRNAQGAVVGYIGANYGLEAIQNFVGDFASSQGVALTVTDRRGILVAAPDGLPPGLNSYANDPRVRAALLGDRGARTWNDDGQSLLSSYAPASGLGWVLLAETPASKAFAPVDQLRMTVLISAGLLGLVLMAGLAFLTLTLRERLRAERELQEQGEETQAILEASADAYMAMDKTGRVVAWSKQAELTFGWTSSEAVGDLVKELIVPLSYRAQFDEILNRHLNEGDESMLDTRIELIALHKNGHEFPIEVVGWMSQSRGRTIYSAFCHDITERKQAAEELSAARDSAMEASRLKSEFVANMSHEIRTPMNGIIGMIDLLRRTDLSSDQRDYADTVWRSAEALLDVINDILDFSKIEAGRMELDDVAFDPRNVMEEASELLAGAAQTKGLELVTVIDPDVPAIVRGDPGRLRQVILNLLGNAVKFTDVGEIVTRCKIDKSIRERISLRIEVSDTGCGIADRDKERLFESFSQVDASSTRRFGGTGLGLAISKRLTELMGGEIGVESKEGVGSTFWFTVDLELPTKGRSQNDSRPQLQRPLNGMRVLIVDDNQTNRTILGRMLSAWGMTADLASGASEALLKLRQAVDEERPYALALLDYNMPEVDGLELAGMMDRDETLRNIRRLLLTSSAERGEMRATQNGQVDGYLTKPVRESSLLSMVTDIVGTPEEKDTEEHVEGEKKHARVLVVDDNIVNRNVTRLMLEKMGYAVDVAEDGKQALDAIFSKAGKYQAVLMDCQMPVMDGYEATRELRSVEPEGTHLPVIAITAHAMKGDIEKCLSAGMDDYLAKPIPWDSLQAVLERQLAGVVRQEEADSASTPSSAIDLTEGARLQNTTSKGDLDDNDRPTEN